MASLHTHAMLPLALGGLLMVAPVAGLLHGPAQRGVLAPCGLEIEALVGDQQRKAIEPIEQSRAPCVVRLDLSPFLAQVVKCLNESHVHLPFLRQYRAKRRARMQGQPACV